MHSYTCVTTVHNSTPPTICNGKAKGLSPSSLRACAHTIRAQLRTTVACLSLSCAGPGLSVPSSSKAVVVPIVPERLPG